VTDNLNLGRATHRRLGVLLDRGSEQREAVEALGRVGLRVSPGGLVSDLSQGEKTLVAVARAYARGAHAYFIDEATSNLTVHDAKIVIDALRAFASSGATVVMITHKLSEVLENADRVVVLLDGRITADRRASELDRTQLVQELASREAADDRTDAGQHKSDGRALLSFDGVRGERLERADFTIRCGQIVGISGLAGSGLHEIAFLAMGELAPHSSRRDAKARVASPISTSRRTCRSPRCRTSGEGAGCYRCASSGNGSRT
jgi:ribose transport system ATP-binding protein